MESTPYYILKSSETIAILHHKKPQTIFVRHCFSAVPCLFMITPNNVVPLSLTFQGYRHNRNYYNHLPTCNFVILNVKLEEMKLIQCLLTVSRLCSNGHYFEYCLPQRLLISQNNKKHFLNNESC